MKKNCTVLATPWMLLLLVVPVAAQEGDEQEIVITPKLHHLGDNKFKTGQGSGNNRLVLRAEGPSLTKRFLILERKVTRAVLCIDELYAKDSPQAIKVFLNGKRVGGIGNGKDIRITVPVGLLKMSPEGNVLTILSPTDKGDVDDIEFRNVRLLYRTGPLKVKDLRFVNAEGSGDFDLDTIWPGKKVRVLVEFSDPPSERSIEVEVQLADGSFQKLEATRDPKHKDRFRSAVLRVHDAARSQEGLPVREGSRVVARFGERRESVDVVFRSGWTGLPDSKGRAGPVPAVIVARAQPLEAGGETDLAGLWQFGRSILRLQKAGGAGNLVGRLVALGTQDRHGYGVGEEVLRLRTATDTRRLGEMLSKPEKDKADYFKARWGALSLRVVDSGTRLVGTAEIFRFEDREQVETDKVTITLQRLRSRAEMLAEIDKELVKIEQELRDLQKQRAADMELVRLLDELNKALGWDKYAEAASKIKDLVDRYMETQFNKPVKSLADKISETILTESKLFLKDVADDLIGEDFSKDTKKKYEWLKKQIDGAFSKAVADQIEKEVQKTFIKPVKDQMQTFLKEVRGEIPKELREDVTFAPLYFDEKQYEEALNKRLKETGLDLAKGYLRKLLEENISEQAKEELKTFDKILPAVRKAAKKDLTAGVRGIANIGKAYIDVLPMVMHGLLSWFRKNEARFLERTNVSLRPTPSARASNKIIDSIVAGRQQLGDELASGTLNQQVPTIRSVSGNEELKRARIYPLVERLNNLGRKAMEERVRLDYDPERERLEAEKTRLQAERKRIRELQDG